MIYFHFVHATKNVSLKIKKQDRTSMFSVQKHFHNLAAEEVLKKLKFLH